MTSDEVEWVVTRLLEEGVPPGVIARVFGLDAELVAAAQSKVRIAQHGTDDMTEYTEIMNWEAVAEARRIIAEGSAAEKSRMLGMVLGKQVALSARRTPESVRKSQDAVIDLMEHMRTAKPKKKPPARSKFIARLENPEASDASP